jgi:hypothetical protein
MKKNLEVEAPIRTSVIVPSGLISKAYQVTEKWGNFISDELSPSIQSSPQTSTVGYRETSASLGRLHAEITARV